MTMTPKAFGTRLRVLRIRHAKKQKIVAEAAGIAQSKLSKIEGGIIDPRFSEVERIIAAIGINGPDLLELFNIDWKDAA